MDYSGCEELFNELNQEKSIHHLASEADWIKFIYQGILGMGHLLGDEEQVTNSIADEINRMSEGPDEPLTVPLGPWYMRLNLRPACTSGLTAGIIAKMMMNFAESSCTDRDVLNASRTYADRYLPVTSADQMKKLTNELLNQHQLPSHSELYRDNYKPHYRVISRFYEPLLTAVSEILRMMTGTMGPWLVTLDGPCASGKTTAAIRLGKLFNARVIHTDEYVVPHARKTVERLQIPGGNCDWERLTQELLIPWKSGGVCWLQPYDCRADRLMPGEEINPSGLLLLEGSYSNMPAIRELADLRLFANTPEPVRMERLSMRETEASLRQFKNRWIPLENAYFDAYGLPDKGCLNITLI